MQAETRTRPYVLVADDDPLMLKSLGLILKAARIPVVTVSTGGEALAQMRREKPLLAFFDVMMAGMNGLELVRLVRQDPKLADITVFLLTARAMPKERHEGLEAGADDYITKPFSNKDLVQRVRKVFEAAGALQP